MKRPNPERNAGARAERAAIRRLIEARRALYESANLNGEAYVLTEILHFITDHAKRTARRKGGTGRR